MKFISTLFPKKLLAVGMLAMFALAGCEKTLEEPAIVFEEKASTSDNAVAQGANQFVSNQVLVKLKRGLSAEARLKALARVGGKMSEKVLTKTMERFGDQEGILLIQTPLPVFEAINKLKAGPEIEFAEPNYIYTHIATSNDPYYTKKNLWGMYGDATSPKNKFGSQAGEAWAAGKLGSTSVVVGIIDEGYMYFHEDLSANAWKNPKEVNGAAGVDDDQNGYVDDIYGWDFDANNKTVYDSYEDDHGTHVAGTIGAKGGNGKGVVGVCWNVKMISAKFLGKNGGTTLNAIKAIDYITDLKKRHGLILPATNNSWGGGGYSQGLKDAIDRANAANILFVAAAGNGGSDGIGDDNDTTPNYPASYASTNIIAVASITSSGALSGFSNYGATTVDMGAPGSGIYSTLPSSSNTSAYGSYSGTSMATPHVTGGIALYASTHSGATAAQIKNAILSSAVPTSSLSGKCVTGGRLNVSGY